MAGMRLWLALVASGLLFPAALSAADFSVEKKDEGVEIKLGGQPFTTYLFKSGAKPVLWPIVGPTGKEMTRAYPLRPKSPEEKDDHLHHRSLWFTYGEVNGISFWHEEAKHGNTVHRQLLKAEGGETATIATINDWVGPDGVKICEDLRVIQLGTDDIEGAKQRWIDYTIVLKASEGEVTLGDTKEGAFGVRVAESMKVDAPGAGHILNSEGETDAKTWGKPAAWVDYTGPVQGEQLGIAILNHPSSFHYPNRWHVRTYGLFAANPFGQHDFIGGEKVEHKIAKGESLTLRYRVVLHQGDAKAGKIAEAFTKFSAAPGISLN